MIYKLEFDGKVTTELEKLVQAIEKGVNGFGIHAQTPETGASTVTGSSGSSCAPGQTCTDSVKIGHDAVILAAAIAGGAVAGYIAGKMAARS